LFVASDTIQYAHNPDRAKLSQLAGIRVVMSLTELALDDTTQSAKVFPADVRLDEQSIVWWTTQFRGQHKESRLLNQGRAHGARKYIAHARARELLSYKIAYLIRAAQEAQTRGSAIRALHAYAIAGAVTQ
jgi:hypothetical protein